MIKDIYEFERCSICKEYKPLKNGVCIDCQDRDFPNFLKDLFRKEDNGYR